MKGWVCAAISAPVSTAGDTREIFGSRDVDAHDLRVSVRRAHEAQVEHIAQLDVVGKLAPTAQQAVLFLARKWLAYPGFRAVTASIALTALSSSQCRLQSVNQLLDLFLSQRLEQAARHRRQAAKDLGLALPGHFCTAIALPGTTGQSPPLMQRCPRPRFLVLYIARASGRSASASSIFTSATPLM